MTSGNRNNKLANLGRTACRRFNYATVYSPHPHCRCSSSSPEPDPAPSATVRYSLHFHLVLLVYSSCVLLLSLRSAACTLTHTCLLCLAVNYDTLFTASCTFGLPSCSFIQEPGDDIRESKQGVRRVVCLSLSILLPVYLAVCVLIPLLLFCCCNCCD